MLSRSFRSLATSYPGTVLLRLVRARSIGSTARIVSPSSPQPSGRGREQAHWRDCIEIAARGQPAVESPTGSDRSEVVVPPVSGPFNATHITQAPASQCLTIDILSSTALRLLGILG